MTAINSPGETAPESQTQQQRPQESGNSLPPAARTRAEWRQFMQQEELDRLQRIENERDQKKTRAEALRSSAAGAQRSQETWTGQKAEKPTLMGMDITDNAKSEISKNVDTEFAANMSLFSEVGLTSPENISALKNVAKEIIFEHFTKTGAKQDLTEGYVKNELVPKLKETFEALKSIYEANKTLFQSPLQFMETFGAFCSLNILSGGRINEAAIKTLLLIPRAGLQSLVGGFREYVPVNADAARLDKEAAALLETGRQRSGGASPAPGTTPAPAPGTTPPTPPAPGSTPGAAPATTPGTSPTSTPGATPPEGQTGTAGTTPPEGSTPPETPEINTGNPIFDKILSAIKSLFPAGFFDQIMSFLGMSPAAAAEFAGLTDPEKKEALVLKEAVTQLKLNEKVMAILYKDGEQVKKILADKGGLINTGWTEYLQQRIDPQEMELLKKDPGMDTQTADKISAMILSPAAPGTTPPTA